jgi:hypothetical protein
VKANQEVASIDPDWQEHCQFPLKTRVPKNHRIPLPKECFSGDLPGISDPVYTFIESIQPYHRVGAANNALRVLVYLSNIDKHRHLNLIRPRVRQYESFRTIKGFRGSGQHALDRGARIEPLPSWQDDRAVRVHRRYRTFVAFKEGDYLGEATTLPVDYLLELILEQIKTTIVPTMNKFIKNPQLRG